MFNLWSSLTRRQDIYIYIYIYALILTISTAQITRIIVIHITGLCCDMLHVNTLSNPRRIIHSSDFV
jgi:hypothetical protein